MDEHGLTWLHRAPTITILPDKKKRQPYPLSWAEQKRLFKELPSHLAPMALFAVNTGCRDSEICNLRWDWQVQVPELDTFVFIIPGSFTKNGDERLVVLNDIAVSVVKAQVGKHATHVFCCRGKPLTRMGNSSWRRIRKLVGLPQVRVHDLKHTFGRRLRAAGVSFEDRQDLLGHRSGRMTTHYSAAELSKLIDAANTVCAGPSGNSPELVVLRRLSVS
jgi:integrase